MIAARYHNLVIEIERIAARRIVEIGTCQGKRAELMIRAATRVSPNEPIAYFGFDLFKAPPEHELSARTPPLQISAVKARLKGLGATVILVAGDTRETLPACQLEGIDLVFIDGGHSDVTVWSDFQNALRISRPGASIMLDDFWNYPGGGGCNALINSLSRGEFDVKILDPIDHFQKPYGTLRTQMVRVIRL